MQRITWYLVATIIFIITTVCSFIKEVNAAEVLPDELGIVDLIKEENVGSITCLTYSLYHEARGQSDMANMMVLATIFNRMESDRFPNTICEVVKQKHQFSYLFDGKSDIIKDVKTYKHLKGLVEKFIMNRELFIGLSEGVLHYHTTSVSPKWNSNMKVVGIVDDHIFYAN